MKKINENEWVATDKGPQPELMRGQDAPFVLGILFVGALFLALVLLFVK